MAKEMIDPNVENIERIATSVEGVELALNEISVALNKLLDFISVVSFEDLEAQVDEKSEELKRV